MIIDAHCHIVVPAMLTAAVPEQWRPVLRSEGGRQVISFRGRTLHSVVAEFCDVDAMLAEAAADGVDHLVLSPWIMLVPVEAAPGRGRPGLPRAERGAGRRRRRPAGSARWAPSRCRTGRGGAGAGRADAACPACAAPRSRPAWPATTWATDRFLPFWEAAADTGALIFVHPTTTGFRLPALAPYYLWNSVGNPLETAITAAQLATAGIMERFPRLKILLAHGGGGLHALRGRLRRAFAVRPEARARSAEGPDAALHRFYYDTVTHDQALLADLVEYAGADHVLLGSDRPFDMGAEHPAAAVTNLGLAAGEQLILGGNARRLLSIADGADPPSSGMLSPDPR